MKSLLAALAGFVLTLAVFVGGAAFATWLLAANPVEQAGPSPDAVDLWSRAPRKVDAAAQNLERLPARPVSPDLNGSSEPKTAAAATTKTDIASAPVDITTTASVQPGPEEQPAGEEQQPAEEQATSTTLPAAHVEWCASRYRSYRPSDNSYTPYSGGRRPCISPYWSGGDLGQVDSLNTSDDDGYVNVAGDSSSSSPDYIPADEGQSLQMTSEHVEYCFSRYRSYRPEDNSYQPYGGGPRRQCQ